MNKLSLALKPQLARFIKQNFPVVKNRSALWFFTNELKSNLTPTTNSVCNPLVNATANNNKSDELPDQDNNHAKCSNAHGGARKSLAKSAPDGSKISRNKILQLWKTMNPESKRKYFNMAEFDELRYKEQKSLWVSEVGKLMQKYGSIDRVIELAPDHERLQTEFLASLEKLQNCYELMIQTESTKMIYKDAIKRVNNNEPSLGSEQLISAVPKHHRAILTKPRRPPAPFVLFLGDNIDKYKQIKRETRTKETVVRLAANEWNSLDNDIKQIYEDRYNKLKDEYLRAMELYKSECLESDENYLQLASLEKKAFKRSLRRRLRNSSVLPLSIRNAFNFFMMSNKDSKLSDATELWRNMSPEEKQKYIKMNQDDVIRYQREIEAYNEMRKTLGDALTRSRRRSKSESEIKL